MPGSGFWNEGPADLRELEVAGLIGRVADVELMPDSDGSGALELAVLGRSQVQVWDPLTQTLLTTAPLQGWAAPGDLELVPDSDHDGIAELATLANGSVQLNDGGSGEPVGAIAFSRYIEAVDLVSSGASGGTSAASGGVLGVLGENRHPRGSDKLELRDPDSGDITGSIWLGKRWIVKQAGRVGDLNGNGADEWAVVRKEGSYASVLLRDGETRAELGSVGFGVRFDPLFLETIADIDGNGTEELAVVGRYPVTGAQRVDVKDAATGTHIKRAYFDRKYPIQDATQCPDINGNGAPEIAIVGQRVTDGQVLVIIKDTKIGNRLRRLPF